MAGFGGLLITLAVDRHVRRQGERGRLKDACAEMLAIAGNVESKLDAHRTAWSAWLGSGLGPFRSLLTMSTLRAALGATQQASPTSDTPVRIFRSSREAEAAAQMLTGITEKLMAAGIAVSLFHDDTVSEASWAVTEAVMEVIRAYKEPKEVRVEAGERLIVAMAKLRDLADDL